MEDVGAVRRIALMAGVILLSFGTTVALTPTFAAGGGGGGGGSGGGASTTCPKGQVYSPKKKKCVQMKSEIVPDDAFACDRSLQADAFRETTGYEPPTRDDMLAELAEEVRRRKRTETA